MKRIWGTYVMRLWVVVLLLVVVGGLWGWLRPTVSVPSRSMTNVVAMAQPTTQQPTATTNTPPSTQIPITATQSVTVIEGPLVTTTQVNSSTMPITATTVMTQGVWTISYFPGATQEMRGWKFQDPSPRDWPKFPNVTNTVASKVYPASWMLEYGVDKDSVCSSVGCFFVVPAGEYRLYSGDYSIPGIDEWQAHDDTGSAIMFVNVGDATAEWEVLMKRGFTYRGRYWHGGHLDSAIWAGMSHVAYRMLNLSGDATNAGANCSNRGGCPKVRLTFVIISGNEVLMKGTSVVSR